MHIIAQTTESVSNRVSLRLRPKSYEPEVISRVKTTT